MAFFFTLELQIPMPVTLAYICVILIWSTTPLAMKWSTEGVGYLFGVISRMGIGMIVAILICTISGVNLPIHRRAVLTYLASGSGVFLTMSCCYWAVQFIPSGWVSVIFGISPLVTSFVASFILREKLVSVSRTGALVVSLTGLYLMFRQNLDIGGNVIPGITAVIAGTIFYSISMVAIKAINADIKPVMTVTGTLIITVLLFSMSWKFSGNDFPAIIPARTAGAILYLGIIGSVLGFMLFYQVLQQVDTTRAALITLITPGCALILGHLLNQEPLTVDILLGCLVVLFGLLLFQFGDAIITRPGRTTEFEG